MSRLGSGLLLSVALAVPWWDRPRRSALAAELAGFAVAGGAAVIVGLLAEVAPGAAARAGVLFVAVLLIAWAWSLPFRAVGWPTAGRLLGLGGTGLCAGTPYLLVESPALLPDWVTAWNPLARLVGSVLERDWFHGPTLYGRVGEGWYRYPVGFEGTAGPLLSAAGALGLALVLGRLSARRGAGATT